MQHQLFKQCADSLRTFAAENHGIKLKATHAHELVAAFFGYPTKNSMLADTEYPITRLAQAEIVVMMPDDFIDDRRECLEGLSAELSDSYKLGEAVYGCLFSDEFWASSYPPFRSYEKLARFLIENDDAYQEVFKFYRDIPVHHLVDIASNENSVTISVTHSTEVSNGELQGHGKTVISLPRVAGRIGFRRPQIRVGAWTGGARRTLGSLRRVQS